MKFKSIEIDSFRGYQKKQKFDFQHKKGEIANLVVIYAPNGFGKTSFFDAIEWSFSGAIKRITANNKVRKIADVEKGNILKNRYSESEIGTVTLVTDRNIVVEAKTAKLGSYGRQTDYVAPIISDGAGKDWIDGINRDMFVSKHLLTHDQIDGFLRFQSPKDRYNSISSFWDNNNDTAFYKEIVLLSKDLRAKQDEYESSMSNLKSDIRKLAPSQPALAYIDGLISKFNSLSDSYNIERKVIYEDVEKFIQQHSKVHSAIKNDYEVLKARLEKAGLLIQNYDLDYDRSISLSKGLQREIMEKDCTIQLHRELSKKLNVSDSIRELIKSNTKEKENYLFIEKHKGEIRTVVQKLETLALEEDNYMAALQTYIENASQLESQLSVLKLERDHVQKELQIKKIRLSEIQQNARYIGTSEQYASLRRRVTRATKVNKCREEQLTNIYYRTQELLKYVEPMTSKFIALGSPNQNSNGIANAYLACLEFYSEISNAKEILDKLMKKHFDYEGLSHNLKLIRELGTEIIIHSQEADCPLCHHQFSTMDALLFSVSKTKNMLALEVINNAISDAQVNIEQLTTRFDESRKVFNYMLDLELQKLAIQRKKVEQRKFHVQILLENAEKTLNEKLIWMEKEKLFFMNHALKIQNDHSKERRLSIFNDYLQETISDIELCEHRCAVNSMQLQEKEEGLKNVSHDIKNVQSFIERNRISVQSIKSSEFFSGYLGYMTQYDLNFDTLDDDIRNLISNIESENQELMIQSDQIKGEVQARQTELGEVRIENILQQKQDLEERLKQVVTVIKEYQFKSSNLFASNDVDLNKMNHKYGDMSKQLEIVDTQQELLSEIIGNIDTIRKNTMYSEKMEEYKLLKQQYDALIDLVHDLEEMKLIGKTHIENKLASELNLDTINSIYRMIDPHPEMSHIKLKLDYSSDDELELNVYTVNNDDSRKEAPILYFSSAQVNVLSLSIFLAGALESDSPINSIFMDDPIQHLDGINMLAFIDLLRILISGNLNKQIIISTHDERFFSLVKRKIDPSYFPSKFLELESFGTIGEFAE